MSKIPVYQFDPKERYRIAGELLEVISQIRSKNDMFNFLFRLLTPSEVLMLARRFQIAKLLINKSTYEQIREELKVRHRTISDVEKWLRESRENAELVSKILKSTNKQNETKKIKSGSMLDRYPYHRLLKDLFK